MGRLFEYLLADSTVEPAATLATPATFRGIDALRVAESQESQGVRPVKATPMTTEEESAVGTWLAHIDEEDPTTIVEVLDKCLDNPEARAYFLRRAREVPPPDTDDRHTCRTCRYLRAGHCIAKQHGIDGEASFRFRPHPDLSRRCAGFVEAYPC